MTSLNIPPMNVINRLSKNIVGEFNSVLNVNYSFCSLFDNLGLDDIANNTNVTNIQFNLV